MAPKRKLSPDEQVAHLQQKALRIQQKSSVSAIMKVLNDNPGFVPAVTSLLKQLGAKIQTPAPAAVKADSGQVDGDPREETDPDADAGDPTSTPTQISPKDKSLVDGPKMPDSPRSPWTCLACRSGSRIATRRWPNKIQVSRSCTSSASARQSSPLHGAHCR